jgi:hypothetical protein
MSCDNFIFATLSMNMFRLPEMDVIGGLHASKAVPRVAPKHDLVFEGFPACFEVMEIDLPPEEIAVGSKTTCGKWCQYTEMIGKQRHFHRPEPSDALSALRARGQKLPNAR